MRLFGRRPRQEPPAPDEAAPGEAAPVPEPGGVGLLDAAEPTGSRLPPEGSYVTDGASLYRVAHSIRDPRDGELIIELEDCRTLELILCSASVIAELRLCAVRPAATG
ncbi:MAG TPA: hypothetical protein VKG82_00125 [Solirubrobacteraceae bacterium]|nr:hypothetical protein [Solirubrobacteraceae bacterium]